MHPGLTLQIFLMDMEEGDRHVASGQKWHEDLNWAKRLDQGWNLSAVKQVSRICSRSWTTCCIGNIVMMQICGAAPSSMTGASTLILVVYMWL